MNKENTSDILVIEDIIKWEEGMGESFLDYHGNDIYHVSFGGFLMAKEPELSAQFIEIMNQRNGEVQNFTEVLEERYPEYDIAYHKLLEYVVEFANLAQNTKNRIFKSLQDNT